VYSPQDLQTHNAGASNFQTLERLLLRLALEVLVFGTAILFSLLYYYKYSTQLAQLEKRFDF
jgi:hypothetical protein